MRFTQLALAATLTGSLLSMPALAESKKELTQKLLGTQQALFDNTAQNLAEQPARQMVAGAKQILTQAVPAEKREATAKLVDAEIKKFLDSAVPLVRASTNKLSASTVAPVLEEKFSEEELRQLIAIMESQVLKKYQTLLPDLIGSTFLEKVVADIRPQIDPKVQLMQSNLRNILDTASGGQLSNPGQAPAAPAAKAAPKPAPKK